MKIVWKWILPLCVLLVAGGVFGYFFFFTEKPAVKEGWGGGAVPVIVAQVEEKPFADSIRALGTAKAFNSVTLTAQVAETVTAVHFTDGDVVETGQLLVELNTAEEQALLKEAEAVLREQQKQLERVRGLIDSGGVAQSRFDEELSLYEAAQARVSSLKARIADRRIHAPFAGVLGLSDIAVGTLVRPGDAIVRLDDISRIKVDFTVPETFLAALRVGQPIEAESAAYPDQPFSGTVRSVDSAVDPATRAITIRALMPNADARLRPGMLMTLDLQTRRRQSLAIPSSAVIPLGQDNFVFVVSGEGRARRQQVDIGQRLVGEVEITAGLEAGQRVIVEGFKARPGAPVRVVEREAIFTQDSES